MACIKIAFETSKRALKRSYVTFLGQSILKDSLCHMKTVGLFVTADSVNFEFLMIDQAEWQKDYSSFFSSLISGGWGAEGEGGQVCRYREKENHNRFPWTETTNLEFRNSVKGLRLFEPPRDKTNNMVCAPSEDSDQPGRPPSLIRVFVAVHMKKAWVLSYQLNAQRRLIRLGWSESSLGAQSLCWFWQN